MPTPIAGSSVPTSVVGASLGSPLKGFSLIELLIVLSIAALMLVVVPPLFSGPIRNAELKAAAYELAAVLKKTRSLAIATQRENSLTLDLTGKRYRSRTRSKKLPKHIHLSLFTARSEQISNRSGSIRFFPDGSATGGRITLKGVARTFHVDVDWLTGRTTVYE